MPVYEYTCDDCEILFEELLSTEETKQYAKSHPCPSCQQMAQRVGVSVVNFNFKAPSGQTQGSGVHGNSGVHNLDYPKLDEAIGRSAEKKWVRYDKEKIARDKARKELGTNAITVNPGNVIQPLSKEKAAARQKAAEITKKMAADSKPKTQ